LGNLAGKGRVQLPLNGNIDLYPEARPHRAPPPFGGFIEFGYYRPFHGDGRQTARGRYVQQARFTAGEGAEMIARRSLLASLFSGCAGFAPGSWRVWAASSSRPARIDAIWKSNYSGTRVWGYVDKHSIAPGEPFNIMLGTPPRRPAVKGKIEIYRIGYYEHADRKFVWRGEAVEAPQVEVQMTAASLGAGWSPAVDHVQTEGWQSGYYTIDFIDNIDGHRDNDVAFIVVTNPEKSGDVLVELSTNTFQAYNEWGGYSFYESAFVGDRAQAISFNRPTPPDFFEYEYYFVLWLEKIAAAKNLRVDYATNFDIFRDRSFATKYKLFVSGSHNEYWSKEEFDAVYQRVFELGGNTLFLGANTAYWQVRYADVDCSNGGPGWGRQLICYKSEDDPIRYRSDEKDAILLVTERFRDEARRPETMLTGTAYQNYFEAVTDTKPKYPYFVTRTDLPFFKGTGYKEGEAIGDIVGYEWDNTDPEGDGKRLWDPNRSKIEPIDRASINVVFTGSPVDLNGHRGKAEAVYFISKAGAKVFSTGSIRWAWGLGKPRFEQEKFKMFNRNLLMHLLELG
jgi:hypothetical protein